LIKLT